MAYIGRGIENFSQIEVLDLITFTTSAGPYNITKDSVAFVPSTINSLLIEVDGIIQAPASYTVDGSTITFGVSMSSSSTMNSMIHFGTGLITTPADGSVTAAKIASDAVTTAKILDNNVTVAKLPTTLNISGNTVTLPATVAGLGTGINVTSQITGVVPTANLGSGSASSSTFLAGDQTYKTITEYDDNTVQSNIAMLGFKVATNGSLVKYDLVKQSIDEFNDTSGVDASASTNEARSGSAPYYYFGGSTSTPTVTQDANATGVDGDYTWYKYTDGGTYSQDAAQSDIDFLVVAGGGAGGEATGSAGYGRGGGGAGGLRTSYSTSGGGASAESKLSIGSGTSYTMTVGGGGAVVTDTRGATGVASSISGSDITDITTVGGGGGGGYSVLPAGAVGGSGGGAGYNTSSGGAAGAGTASQGYAGGTSDNNTGGGGGGAGAVGGNNSTYDGGAGGVGLSNSITGSAVFYAGGGGAGGNAGSDNGGNGGGGRGSRDSGNVTSVAGTANTGGGGGGGLYASATAQAASAGGSGIVIIRRLTTATTSGTDLTLQSTDSTALSSPTYGEFVTLIENAYGTATLNTDIKGYVSRDSGTTFTQGTLVDEGTWGTNKKILGFHDLTITGAAGTSMCYKITTHNQAASSKETRVYATSIGWR